MLITCGKETRIVMLRVRPWKRYNFILACKNGRIYFHEKRTKFGLILFFISFNTLTMEHSLVGAAIKKF